MTLGRIKFWWRRITTDARKIRTGALDTLGVLRGRKPGLDERVADTRRRVDNATAKPLYRKKLK